MAKFISETNLQILNLNFKACNRSPEELFRKYFPRVTSVQMVFEWPSKVYLYVTWNTNLLRIFLNKKSYPLKSKIVLSSKTFLGQNTCNSIRNYLSASLFNLSLSREVSSSLLLTSEKGLRDWESLVVEDSWTQGKGCPCVVQTL